MLRYGPVMFLMVGIALFYHLMDFRLNIIGESFIHPVFPLQTSIQDATIFPGQIGFAVPLKAFNQLDDFLRKPHQHAIPCNANAN